MYESKEYVRKGLFPMGFSAPLELRDKIINIAKAEQRSQSKTMVALLSKAVKQLETENGITY